uniref:BolA family iron metabolism protein IbaG n=1 Tax=Candidatus Aschnera chinzeii TaxID=1485666 RepID=A0AAT9G4X5_9ENTR|nr:MAG: BolA family iron metabolism protein IbaG [Candidatus Aschnera chinzeii]
MNIKIIKNILLQQLKLEQVIINQEGNLFKIIVVGEIFNGINTLERQKLVYHPLMSLITENKIHALSINAYTPIEWMKCRNNK